MVRVEGYKRKSRANRFKKQDLNRVNSGDKVMLRSGFGGFWDFLSSNAIDYLPKEYRCVKNKHVHLFIVLFLFNLIIWKYFIFPRTDRPVWDFFFTFALAFLSLAVMFKVIEKVESRISSQ